MIILLVWWKVNKNWHRPLIIKIVAHHFKRPYLEIYSISKSLKLISENKYQVVLAPGNPQFLELDWANWVRWWLVLTPNMEVSAKEAISFRCHQTIAKTFLKAWCHSQIIKDKISLKKCLNSSLSKTLTLRYFLLPSNSKEVISNLCKNRFRWNIWCPNTLIKNWTTPLTGMRSCKTWSKEIPRLPEDRFKDLLLLNSWLIRLESIKMKLFTEDATPHLQVKEMSSLSPNLEYAMVPHKFLSTIFKIHL